MMGRRILRLRGTLSLAGAAIGLGLFATSIACSGGDKEQAQPGPTDTAEPPTATSTATATSIPTATPTATATPTPFAGPIGSIQIPRFNVNAPIEELAINSRNELDTPKNTNVAVGWYYIYDRPGWDGNAVFSAHVYYHSIPAPFQRLAQSTVDDEIKVVMENGATYTYKVISNKRYHRDTIPMGDIIWPPDRPKEKQWITLITCGGELDSTGQEYISRDVVVAERIS